MNVYIVRVSLAQQYSLDKGLWLFGDRSDVAVTTELTQIHKMDTYESIDPKTMSCEDRKGALASLLFVTEKRSREIKASEVIDESKQRLYDGYDHSDRLSLTIASDSIFVTGAVNTKEDSAVTIVDIDNTFLHVGNDKRISMLLRGKLVEFMAKVNPLLYRKCVILSPKGVPMICSIYA